MFSVPHGLTEGITECTMGIILKEERLMMLNPIVISVPGALATVAALAAWIYLWQQDVSTWSQRTPRTTTAGRHRLASATAPYRPRPAAERRPLVSLAATADRWNRVEKELDDVLDAFEAALTRPPVPRACNWHEEGGYGFVWSCRSCNPALAETVELAAVR